PGPVDLAGGAAGGLLLLDRHAPGGLAAAGPCGGADPGLRHRRGGGGFSGGYRGGDGDPRARPSGGPGVATGGWRGEAGHCTRPTRERDRRAGPRVDAEEGSPLRFSCRPAKEKLLEDGRPVERWPVTIAGRGSRVIGGSIQSELTREEVLRIVLDGFFPMTP